MALGLTLNDTLAPWNGHRAPKLPASHSQAAGQGGAHARLCHPGFYETCLRGPCLQPAVPQERKTAHRHWVGFAAVADRSPDPQQLGSTQGPQTLVVGWGDRRYWWSMAPPLLMRACHNNSSAFVGQPVLMILGEWAMVENRDRATRQLLFWSQFCFCISLSLGTDWCLSLVTTWLQQATQLMRPSSGWPPVSVLPVPLNSYSQMKDWELRKRFPTQEQCAGSWPALHKARARLLGGVACGCWTQLQQVRDCTGNPMGHSSQHWHPPRQRQPQTRSIPRRKTGYGSSSLEGKELSSTNILYHLAAALKSIHQPILVSIQAQKRSWSTCRMSASKAGTWS